MLILSRMMNEEVVIGDPRQPGKVLGVVRVADIRGDKVRLGFEFAGEVTVDRAEVAADKVLNGVRDGDGGGA